MRPLLFAVTLIAALCGLAACGNKGPLYMPEPAAEPQTTPPRADGPPPVSDQAQPAPPAQEETPRPPSQPGTAN